MKRWAVRICVLLLLGAIVNVAVAWGCASWSAREELYDIYFDVFTPIPAAKSDVTWLSARHQIELDEAWTFGALSRVGFTRHEFYAIPRSRFTPMNGGGSTGSYPALVARTQSGVPFPALECEDYHVDGIVSWDREYRNAIPVMIEVDIGGPIALERPLPCRPIWPGFAINTVFYAVILWGLFAAPFALRRSRRIKRGLCPKCAYPVGTNAVCTECGTAVMPRVKSK